MKKGIAFLIASVLISIVSHAAVTVDIYTGHFQTGGGAPFSGLVGSFTSTDVMFATDTGYAWHPFGLSDFGADISGCLNVAAEGTYLFTLDSDDGSMLYIDSLLVVDNGGGHSPQMVTGSAYLSDGLHSFRVEFFEDFGGPSGVDLWLPQGVGYSECAVVPTPGAIVLTSIGVTIAGWLGRKKYLI